MIRRVNLATKTELLSLLIAKKNSKNQLLTCLVSQPGLKRFEQFYLVLPGQAGTSK